MEQIQKKYQRDEVMEQFQSNVSQIMTTFYTKQSEKMLSDSQLRYQQRMYRVEQMFETSKRKLQEERDRHRKTDNLFCQLDDREMQMIAQTSKALGLQSDLSPQDHKRIIKLMRKFSKRQLKPVKIKSKQPIQHYCFPFDIWHLITQYCDMESLLKIEKSCRAIYLMFNQKCKKCCDSTLVLSEQCTSKWRQMYQQYDCPFQDQEIYLNVNCRIMKALLSRMTLQQIAPQKLMSLRNRLCIKDRHALRALRKSDKQFTCDICLKEVPLTKHCGRICPTQKQYNLACLYPRPHDGKEVLHKCFCICCMSQMNETDQLQGLRKDLGFYLGLKPSINFVTFHQPRKGTKTGKYAAAKEGSESHISISYIAEY